MDEPDFRRLWALLDDALWLLEHASCELTDPDAVRAWQDLRRRVRWEGAAIQGEDRDTHAWRDAIGGGGYLTALSQTEPVYDRAWKESRRRTRDHSP